MNEQNEMQGYKTVITSEARWFDLKLDELWEYRDLVLLFVKRNFTSRYKQTILGPAWAVINPLLTTVVFTLIFGNIAGLADCGQVPRFLFYLCGNTAWQFFSGSLVGTSETFIANRHIMGKVYFPRMVVPVATVMTQLIGYGIQLVMLLGFYIGFSFMPGYSFGPSPVLWLAPLCVLEMCLLGMGCGIIVSALTTRYRDLQMLVSFGVSLWMYGTPVAYSLSVFKNSPVYQILLLNPMTAVIETLRCGMLGLQAGSWMPVYYALSWVVTMLLVVVGMMLFNRVEKNFMDTV